jgi:ABC-type glycerol-3-phosphate transport system substrate-binding protein
MPPLEVNPQIQTQKQELPQNLLKPNSTFNKTPKKFIAITIAAAFALLVITSLLAIFIYSKTKNRSVNQTPQKVDLLFWGTTESEELINQIISEYAKTHQNVNIKYEKRPLDEYDEIAYTRIKSQDPSVTPDIIEIEGYLVRDLLDYLSSPPPQLFTPESIEEKFFPAAKKVCSRIGTLYCVPAEFNGIVLIYNKSWLENSGITTIPNNWDDFQKTAKTLTNTVKVKEGAEEKEIITKSGACLGTGTSTSHSGEIVFLLMLQNRVPLDKWDGWKQMNSEKGVVALDFYRSFYDQKIWDESLGNSLDAFLGGKCAMAFADIKDVYTVIKSNASFQWKTTMPPQIFGQINLAQFKVLAVPKSSRHQQEAWDFVSYFLSSEVQGKIFQFEGPKAYKKIPPNRDLIHVISKDNYLSGFSEIFITSNSVVIPRYKLSTTALQKGLDESLSNDGKNDSQEIIDNVIREASKS